MSDIYDRLGVQKVISCCGTFTTYGGALMAPQVLEAMAEASRTHVVLTELQQKAGARIAELIGVEAAFITTGAAGGLFLSTAALLAGRDPVKMKQLPDTTGMKNECIVCKCHRFSYDHAISTVGAKIVEFGDDQGVEPWQMEQAIGENTAFCLYAPAHNDHAALPFETFRDIAKAHNIPILCDHAAEVPPASNLRLYSDLGADLVVISGGKGLRGPQSTGLILGSKDLIESCAAHSNPNGGVIGRPLKVGKEEIAGIAAAVEFYLTDISKHEHEIWEGMISYILKELEGIPHVKARRHFPYNPTRTVPVVVIELEDALGMTVKQVTERLKQGNPPIYVHAPDTGFGYAPGKGFIINPHTMREGEEIPVAKQIKEIVVNARVPA